MKNPLLAALSSKMGAVKDKLTGTKTYSSIGTHGTQKLAKPAPFKSNLPRNQRTFGAPGQN